MTNATVIIKKTAIFLEENCGFSLHFFGFVVYCTEEYHKEKYSNYGAMK